MNKIGKVVVCTQFSAKWKRHAITINSTLSFEELNLDGPQKDFPVPEHLWIV
jgi:5'-nucleotidase